jgi:leucyl aminopeptidase (aminopeptidase T)
VARFAPVIFRVRAASSPRDPATHRSDAFSRKYPAMKFTSSRLAGALCVAALAGMFAVSGAAAEKPDYKAVAERIVGQSAGVKEGDRVVLRGDPRDLELLEQLSLATWRRGAEPLQVVVREKAAHLYFDEVPGARDAAPLGLSMKLAEVANVEITVGGQEFPALLSDVAPARLAVIETRNLTAFKARLNRGVRLVELGNGLYPTDATAKRWGLTKDQLATLFWRGVNVDYTKLQSTAVAVRGVLAGREVRVTHANGTDLTVRIGGREVGVSDGVISAEDIVKGPPNTQVWLPAGEVYVTPVPGTAEGKIVFDSIPFDDGEILAFTLTFKAGKLVSHAAKPGAHYERWKALYAAAPAARDEFSLIDIGINPNITVPAGSKLATWVPAGTVSLGIGNNTWAGGSNDVAFNFAGSLNGGTVIVDGKTLVDKGALKTP